MNIFERFFGSPKPEDKSEAGLVKSTGQEEPPFFDESDSGDGVPEELEVGSNVSESTTGEKLGLSQEPEVGEVDKVE